MNRRKGIVSWQAQILAKWTIHVAVIQMANARVLVAHCTSIGMPEGTEAAF